jgi:hypothetical protein
MHKPVPLAFIVTILLAGNASAASAHHSFSAIFDADQPLEVTGSRARDGTTKAAVETVVLPGFRTKT